MNYPNYPINMARSSPQRAQESMIKPLVASCVAFLLVSTAIVTLRFYVRLRVIRNFGKDDMALAVTMISTVAAGGVTLYATNVGLGTHIETLSIDKKRSFLKFVFVSSLGYHVDLMLLKATFLLQYRRAFPLPAFQRICDVLLAFFAVWALAGLIGGATICLPLEQNWDPISPVWACKKRLWFWVGHGIVHVVTDVVILIMPLPLLKTLPLPRLHKIVLIGIFCLGFCTCVISAIRLTTLRPSFEDPDVTWTSATTVFFSVGEVACSIVCLCIPTLRPLVGRCSCCGRLGGSRNIMGLHPEEFRLSVPSTAGTIRPPSSLVPLTGVSTSSNR